VETQASPPLKDVLALGSAIVKELELDTRGELLQRWMAHHLADLISKANDTSGPEKAEHERAATDLILKLWLHRRGLPLQADPLAGYEDALNVLKQLRPESNPWLRFQMRGKYLRELRTMFDSMARAILGGIALTQLSSPQTIGQVQAKFIDPAEATLLEAFEQWQPIAIDPPTVRVVYVEAGAKPAGYEVDDADEQDAPESTAQSASPIADEAALAQDVSEQLSKVHAQLGQLLDAWNAARGKAAEEDDAPASD
jgi:hypothetical protein